MTDVYLSFLNNNFVNHRLINVGNSLDEKYYAQGRDGSQFFVRFANAGRIGRLTKEFEILKQASNMGISTPRPVELGNLGGGGYMLVEWVNGDMLSEVLPSLEKKEQYKLGRVAGEMLQHIHTIPINGNIDEWTQCPYEKMKANIKGYPQYFALFTNAEKKLVRYIEENKQWLQPGPIAFLHGDYKPLNMMIVDGALMVIDFNSFLYSVVWADMGKVVSKAMGDYPFYKGLINQYFGGEPSNEAVQRIILYAALHRIDHFFNNILFGRIIKSNDDFFDTIKKITKHR